MHGPPQHVPEPGRRGAAGVTHLEADLDDDEALALIEHEQPPHGVRYVVAALGPLGGVHAPRHEVRVERERRVQAVELLHRAENAVIRHRHHGVKVLVLHALAVLAPPPPAAAHLPSQLNILRGSRAAVGRAFLGAALRSRRLAVYLDPLCWRRVSPGRGVRLRGICLWRRRRTCGGGCSSRARVLGGRIPRIGFALHARGE